MGILPTVDVNPTSCLQGLKVNQFTCKVRIVLMGLPDFTRHSGRLNQWELIETSVKFLSEYGVRYVQQVDLYV